MEHQESETQEPESPGSFVFDMAHAVRVDKKTKDKLMGNTNISEHSTLAAKIQKFAGNRRVKHVILGVSERARIADEKEPCPFPVQDSEKASLFQIVFE